MDSERKKWRSFLRIIIPLLLICFLADYVFSNWYIEQKFGRGYKLEYWDAGYSRITHMNKAIIDEPIMSCGHNRLWIIAKTTNKDYYLIKKSKLFSWDGSDQVIYGPMDSSSFYGIMQEKGLQSIELRTLRRYDK